ncbi:MAG: 50S ribosomal protein L4 [Vulcanimicrobiota bacterium]
MARINVVDKKGNNREEIELNSKIFEQPVKVHHLHAAVQKQLNNKRLGTVSTKTRAEVSGGGKKPWRQKGTGRARHGSIRSPIWKGGGITFGPKPRDYSTKLTRKMRRLALKEALSSKVKDNRLVVMDEIKLDKIRTRDFVQMIKDMKLEGKVLFVLKEYDPIVEKSGRNIEGVRIVKVEGVSVYDLLYFDTVVFVKDALMRIEEVLA